MDSSSHGPGVPEELAETVYCRLIGLADDKALGRFQEALVALVAEYGGTDLPMAPACSVASHA